MNGKSASPPKPSSPLKPVAKVTDLVPLLEKYAENLKKEAGFLKGVLGK